MTLIFEEKNTLGGGWSIDVKRLSRIGKNHSRVKNGTYKEGKVFPLIQGYIKKSLETFNYYSGESFPPTLNTPELTDLSLKNLMSRLQNGEGSTGNINFNAWS